MRRGVDCADDPYACHRARPSICSREHGRAPLWAHHAFAAEFDAKKPIKLQGTITKVEWINPHSWIHIDVKDADGKVTNWMVEGGSPNALLSQGWKVDSLKQGARVAVTGFGARNGSHLANAIKVVLGGTAYSAIREENRSLRDVEHNVNLWVRTFDNIEVEAEE